MTLEQAREIAAQCWCDPETSSIEMDVRLAEAFAWRLAALSSPQTPPPDEGEREATEKDRAYASLVRVADRYVAFCHQAGVEANASSLDPTEQLHAQALAALARARLVALTLAAPRPPSSPPRDRCLAAVCDCRDHQGDAERDRLMGRPPSSPDPQEKP